MKAIKFRAWDKDLQKMFNVLELHFHNGGINAVEYEPYQKSICKSLYKNGDIIDECALMQFTGLCDKNEKEIYDGDISNSVYGIGKVYWCNMTAKFMFEFDTDCTDLFSICSGQDKKYFEVIGNIYENNY